MPQRLSRITQLQPISAVSKDRSAVRTISLFITKVSIQALFRGLRVRQLYIRLDDVQTQPLLFLNVHVE